jgi:predicted SAM-dependent methyltransferase
MHTDKNNILSTLKERKLVVLELGIGTMRNIKDAITIDQLDNPAVDIVTDLNKGFPFIEDNSVDAIYSFHFLEHVENLEFLMTEIYRVLKVGGKNIGTVPHFSNPYFYSDYTHKAHFGLYSFAYFSKTPYFKRQVPGFYNACEFTLENIKVEFISPFRVRNQFKKIQQWLFNSSKFLKEYYEENMCYIFPAYQIRFVLKKV